MIVSVLSFTKLHPFFRKLDSKLKVEPFLVKHPHNDISSFICIYAFIVLCVLQEIVLSSLRILIMKKDVHYYTVFILVENNSWYFFTIIFSEYATF